MRFCDREAVASDLLPPVPRKSVAPMAAPFLCQVPAFMIVVPVLLALLLTTSRG